MPHRLTLVIAFCLWICIATAAPLPKIIFDTDMTGDCDDCGALALLHALADTGEVEILGCIASFGGNPYVVGCIDAINTYYGRGDLPVGAVHDVYGWTESRYLEAIATDTARYGHDLVTKADAPDHVHVYRELLASQPDGSVTIVTVGRLKALADLLDSKPDDISDLDGIALVKKKARHWVCMGGRYPNSGTKGEANFHTAGGAGYSKKAVEAWPLSVTFSGWEIGKEIMTGRTVMKDTEDNPVARAYRLFLGSTEKQRESWDQTAVLVAVRGTAPWWDIETTGHNEVRPDGVNAWRSSPDKEQSYLVKRQSPAEIARLISSLMAQAPLGRK
jgi:inosine-uridine nucleoside N-ribohydrolase